MEHTPIVWSDLWSFEKAPSPPEQEGDSASPYFIDFSFERPIHWKTDFTPAIVAALESESALMAKDGAERLRRVRERSRRVLSERLQDPHVIVGEAVVRRVHRWAILSHLRPIKQPRARGCRLSLAAPPSRLGG